MRKRLNAILAVLAFAVLSMACTQQADIGITTKVKSLLESDRAITNSAQIQVTTEKKVVTLAGPVDSPATKAHAVILAKGVEGVKKVVDNLTVTPASIAAAQPATAEAVPDTTTAPTDPAITQPVNPTDATSTKAVKPTDSAIKQPVKTTDTATKAAKPTTDKAIPQAAKPTTDTATPLAALPATDTAATQAVKPTDTAITQAVKEKLLLRPEASSEIIGVDTHEGVVTLSGTVKSPEVKAQVIQIARSTEGVQRVEDKLSVSSS